MILINLDEDPRPAGARLLYGAELEDQPPISGMYLVFYRSKCHHCGVFYATPITISVKNNLLCQDNIIVTVAFGSRDDGSRSFPLRHHYI